MRSLLMVILMGVFLKGGYSTISCYHCHQTSAECNSPQEISLETINCTSNKCFVLKYETEMPGVDVLATYRGCYVQPEKEIMENVITDKARVRKLHFKLCNSTLCNSSTKTNQIYNIFYLLLFHLLKVVQT